MDFRTLEVLFWLIKDPNLKRTAERLNVSQPSLTKRLGRLEKEVGLKLFERRGSLGMIPTRHAIELAETARTILDTWSYATNLTKIKSSERPYIKINGPSIFMQLVFGPLWAKSDLSLNYTLHCQSSTTLDLAVNTSEPELDAAFLFDKSKAMDFKFIPVCTERMAVIYNADAKVHHDTLLKKSKDGISWLSYKPNTAPLNLFMDSKLLPKKEVVGYFEDLSVLLNIISQDARYATVLPYHSLLYDQERLRGLPLPGSENVIYFVYRPQEDRQEALKLFGESMALTLKDHPLFSSGKR